MVLVPGLQLAPRVKRGEVVGVANDWECPWDGNGLYAFVVVGKSFDDVEEKRKDENGQRENGVHSVFAAVQGAAISCEKMGYKSLLSPNCV